MLLFLNIDDTTKKQSIHELFYISWLS